MRQPEMRPELAAIITARYGTPKLDTAISLQLDDGDVRYYNEHDGRLPYTVSLYGDPHLIVIDIGKLKHLHYAWIEIRRPTHMQLILSSGIRPVPKDILSKGELPGRVEGLELTVHYPHPNRYTAELKPLY